MNELTKRSYQKTIIRERLFMRLEEAFADKNIFIFNFIDLCTLKVVTFILFIFHTF